MDCPMCGQSEKFQKPDDVNENKTQCTACGTKFHDPSKRYKK